MRDFEHKRLQLMLELTVQDRRALHARQLLHCEVAKGITVADLELGSTVKYASAGEMATVEHDVRTHLAILNRYMEADAGNEEVIDIGAPALLQTPLQPSAVPEHEHPQYEPRNGLVTTFAPIFILLLIGAMLIAYFFSSMSINHAFEQLGVKGPL